MGFRCAAYFSLWRAGWRLTPGPPVAGWAPTTPPLRILFRHAFFVWQNPISNMKVPHHHLGMEGRTKHVAQQGLRRVQQRSKSGRRRAHGLRWVQQRC